MAKPLYQEGPGEYLVGLAFANVPGVPRVDCLMVIDGRALIVGYYLGGKYAGKRLLVFRSWNRKIVLLRWINHYDRSADGSIFDNATELPTTL